MAFDIRLSTILSIFSGSQAMIFSSTSVSKIIFRPLLSVKVVTDSTISSTISTILLFDKLSSKKPYSILDKSIMLLISLFNL